VNILEEYGITEDPRFKTAGREAIQIVFYWILYTVWTYGFGIAGTLVQPEQYTYTWGFPTWYFWGIVGSGFLFPFIGIVMAIRLKDCSLDPWVD